MSGPDPIERLRDAYIALGSAVADLRSLPIRRYAGGEEDLHISAAVRSIGAAQSNLEIACEGLNVPVIQIEVDPKALMAARAIARPLVWEWIADLIAAREQVAVRLLEGAAPVPDDLPAGSFLERLGGTPAFRLATTLLFVAVVLAGIALGATAMLSG